MHNTFLSVVALVYPDTQVIADFLSGTCKVLKENFQYYEFILINNGLDPGLIKRATDGLDRDIKQYITVINLSRHAQSDHAVVAGLDRANGDYTVIFDMNLYNNAELILKLYEKTQEDFDIVYLRYKRRKLPFGKLIFFKAFYALIKRYSDLDININDHNCRIISRRALNSIIKLRENLRYMKGIFSYVGYNQCPVEADIPEDRLQPEYADYLFQSPSPSIKLGMVALISFTNFMHRILMAAFIVALLFSCFVTADAIAIKLTGVDLFGTVQRNTDVEYLVVLVSIMFSFLFFILYIFSVYLTGIDREIRRRPLYFIQSIQRLD